MLSKHHELVNHQTPQVEMVRVQEDMLSAQYTTKDWDTMGSGSHDLGEPW